MIRVCAWCARLGTPSFLEETEPYEDTNVTHGICSEHAVEWRARADELHSRRLAEKALASR